MAYADDNGIYRVEDSDNISPINPLFNMLAQSVSDRFDTDTQIFRVANISQRNALVGTPAPTSANPIFAWRADAPAGQQLEYTRNGSTWFSYSSSEAPSKLPAAIATGTVTVQALASSGGSAPVALPAGMFTTPPLIMLTKQSGGAAKYIPYASSVTVSGFTAGIYSGDGTPANQTAIIGWVAFSRGA